MSDEQASFGEWTSQRLELYLGIMSDKPFFLALAVLLATISLVAVISSRGEPRVVKTNLERFPMVIGIFQGHEDHFSDTVNRELNADAQIYRHYRSNGGEQVDLYIGYYGTAKGGRTGHNPFACLPGAGWGVIDSYPVHLTSRNHEKGVDVNYVLARKGDAYFTALHWYQSAGNIVLGNGIQQNLRRFVDRLSKNRNDGAFVRVSIASREGQIHEAKLLGMEFGTETLNLLPDYWPEESVQ